MWSTSAAAAALAVCAAVFCTVSANAAPHLHLYDRGDASAQAVLSALFGMEPPAFEAWVGTVYRQRFHKWGPASKGSGNSRLPPAAISPADPLFASGLLHRRAVELDALASMLATVRAGGDGDGGGDDGTLSFQPAENLLRNVLAVRDEGGGLLGDLGFEELAGFVGGMRSHLAAGMAYIFRISRLGSCFDHQDAGEGEPHPAAPLRSLQEKLRRATGLDPTIHVYLSGKAGSRALPLHTDPYDVLAIQINGSKNWEVRSDSPIGWGLPSAHCGC